MAASLFLSRRRDVAYADVATWLQLGPLVEVQKNLRALRAQIRAAADDSSAVRRIDTQLAREPIRAILCPLTNLRGRTSSTIAEGLLPQLAGPFCSAAKRIAMLTAKLKLLDEPPHTL